MKSGMNWIVMTVLASAATMQAAVKTENWGRVEGKVAHLYTLSSPTVSVKLTDYGARLVSVVTPDKSGKKTDILLGYSDIANYGVGEDPSFGPIVGRFGNRIKNGTFSLAGQIYHVATNEGANTLHGGNVGFDRLMWSTTVLGPRSIEFSLESPEGDQGFPGRLTAHVVYALEGNKLTLKLDLFL